MGTKQIQSEKIILGDRLTLGQFLSSEAVVFFAQTLVFFLVAVFMSGLLTQESALVDFVNSKINKNTTTEFVATLVALFAVLGAFALFVQGMEKSSSQLAHRIAEEVSLDAPRIVYASGSSITGAVLASGVFVLKNPATQAPPPVWWFSMAAFFAIFFFFFGSALSYWLKRKTHIKAVPKPSSAQQAL